MKLNYKIHRRRWTRQRMEEHVRKAHPWLTESEISLYLSIDDANERSRLISTLKYYRKKDGKS